MPSQDESRPSGASPRPYPKARDASPIRLGSIVTEQKREVEVYDDILVVKSPSRRVELRMGLTERERFALASLIRPPVSEFAPAVESAFGSGKVSAQEWLREAADVTAEAEEAGIVLSDVREEDIEPSAFNQIAEYIDWLEQSVIERDEMIATLNRQLEAR